MGGFFVAVLQRKSSLSSKTDLKTAERPKMVKRVGDFNLDSSEFEPKRPKV